MMSGNATRPGVPHAAAPQDRLPRRGFLQAGAAAAAGLALPSWAQAKAASRPGHEIVAADAVTLSRWIRTRQVSCREVMVAYLAQIDRVNPQVNAIVTLQDREQLLAQASERDRQLAAGRVMGWLHGIPQAPKDLAATAGIVTTQGSPLFKDYVPKTDAVIVERARRHGAVLIGKTNTPEFGLGSHTYNSVFGTTLNAYDARWCAGGSSGGAAVALATHMLPVADGSDMMGSLRNPAAFNNVFGLRPSQGRVPYGPTGEVFVQQLGYEGPMGRTVADVAMLLSVQAGFDARVPLSLDDDPQRFTHGLKRDFKGTRIGWLGDLNGYLATEPGVMPLCESALKSFEALGCRIDAVQPAYSPEALWKTWLTLRHFTIANAAGPLYQDPAKRALMKPEALWEIEGGLGLKADEVWAASVQRTRWYQSLLALFQQHDYLVLPSAQVFPFDAQQHWPREINGRAMDTYHRWMEVVVGPTLAGLPVLNVPAGFSAAGQPMGLQVIGKPRQDFEVLQLGHAYEQAAPWVRRRPSPLA